MPRVNIFSAKYKKALGPNKRDINQPQRNVKNLEKPFEKNVTLKLHTRDAKPVIMLYLTNSPLFHFHPVVIFAMF